MRAAKHRLILGTTLCLLLLRGFAQDDLTSWGANENLTLGMNAETPARFIAVHGRRALIQGYAARSLEAWVYPFQILSNYRVAFRPRGATTAIEGQDILSRVDYEPDSVTRIYLGPAFIVREKLFVPLNQPGSILTYSIGSRVPIEIDVHAKPVLNLMWPAALGGQSVSWSPSSSAFILSEPALGFTAVVGSPDIVAHDEIGNRTMRGVGDAELGFTLHPGATGIASVFVALNPPHATDPGALLRMLTREREALEKETAAHLDEFRESVLGVETPDDEANRAIAWAEIALDQAWVCNPDLGCGYVAGYGPSRDARRPQYDWFFAGDGLIAAEAALAAGDRVHARDELDFILHYQDNKTGMIWHELSQSAGMVDWVGKYPYMFVHVDITFQFLGTVGRYVGATGDTAFAREHWQAIEAAYRYCLSVIDSATALPRIPADKEGGNEQDRMADDLGLSTSWVDASAAFAQLAGVTGHSDLASEAARANRIARNAIPGRYWDANQSFWISGHTQTGQPMTMRRSGPSEALTMHIFDPKQNVLMLDELASSSFQTDWGTRGIGAGSADFDPESYAKGSVWPVGTAALAETFWSEHRPVTALSLWRSLIPLASIDSPGHMDEVLQGNVFHPQDESVPEQTWSSAGFVEATMHGLLGLQVDQAANRLVFAPRMPATWSNLSVAHIRLSGPPISLALHLDADELTLHIENPGAPFQLDFAPNVPLGAKLRRAIFNDHAIACTFENYPEQTDAKALLGVPHGRSELRVAYSGGISIVADAPRPMLGDPSTDIHIVDVDLTGTLLTIDADVPTGRASHLHLKTDWKMANAAGVTVQQIEPGRMELTFAESPGASGPYRRTQATLKLDVEK